MMMMCMRAQLDITGVIAAYYEITNTFFGCCALTVYQECVVADDEVYIHLYIYIIVKKNSMAGKLSGYPHNAKPWMKLPEMQTS
jgi:hypothetical protein